MSAHKLIVVTPVYEDRDVAERLFRELRALYGATLFVLAVDDGSVREPLTVEVLERAKVDGAILRLVRNVGHQRAIAIGLGYVAQIVQEGQTVVVMDSDGEDLPGSIKDLLDELRDERVDMAVAARRSRVETFRFKAFYVLYRLMFRVMTGKQIGFGNFMALKPHAVRRLASMQELQIHAAATAISSKLRIAVTSIARGPRYAGQSKMNFVGLVLHGFKAMMVFAEDVLVRVGVSCAGVGVITVLGIVSAIALKLTGYSTPGWFSVALGLMTLILMQTGALTLMTLMLVGVMRAGNVATKVCYQDFIEKIMEHRVSND
ncbi:glycosyltransferase [Ferribacterium limneticum]|uniref:glycosyltransferase n=1 Tax=Ferribacterium limneticum TaxID=76259 RepID=UPI001CF9DD30|nr:glycosyltransferase [Ferribacterium limneticum]UCV19541.1 glycosyltransferase [Ferribacterium limneticum]